MQGIIQSLIDSRVSCKITLDFWHKSSVTVRSHNKIITAHIGYTHSPAYNCLQCMLIVVHYLKIDGKNQIYQPVKKSKGNRFGAYAFGKELATSSYIFNRSSVVASTVTKQNNKLFNTTVTDDNCMRVTQANTRMYNKQWSRKLKYNTIDAFKQEDAQNSMKHIKYILSYADVKPLRLAKTYWFQWVPHGSTAKRVCMCHRYSIHRSQISQT